MLDTHTLGKLLFYTAVLLVAIFGFRHYSLATNTLKIGDNAPGFTLKDAKGKAHSLQDYTGKYVVLYFYPKDDTPVCAKEACHFRDDLSKLENLGAKVVGISVDTSESHDAFTKKYHLNFPLLADNDAKVAVSYNALTNLLVTRFSKRHTFLIDPTGKIARIYTSVDVSNHSQQIIEDLKLIQNQQ